MGRARLNSAAPLELDGSLHVVWMSMIVRPGRENGLPVSFAVASSSLAEN